MANPKFDGGLLHFTAIRGRITGVGLLQLFIRSLDDINYVQLTSLSMQVATNRLPNTLANYLDQKGQVEFKVVESGHYFIISNLDIFIRPSSTGYPQ